jgi:hypothetical protein
MDAPIGRWTASSYCAHGACLEIARTTTGVAMRANSYGQSNHLGFGKTAWQTFVEALKAGELTPVGPADVRTGP